MSLLLTESPLRCMGLWSMTLVAEVKAMWALVTKHPSSKQEQTIGFSQFTLGQITTASHLNSSWFLVPSASSTGMSLKISLIGWLDAKSTSGFPSGNRTWSNFNFAAWSLSWPPSHMDGYPSHFRRPFNAIAPMRIAIRLKSSTRFPVRLPFCSATKARCVNISSLRFRSHLHPVQELCLL